MSTLIDNCINRLSSLKSSQDILTSYGYACTALIGGVHLCPLGIPNLKVKIVFNIGEELLRTATQNTQMSVHKTRIGWLILSAFMTLGTSIVKKHLPRMILLWKTTMLRNMNKFESEKNVLTFQLMLEARTGVLMSIYSFITNCHDLSNHEALMKRIFKIIENEIQFLPKLPNLLKSNSVFSSLKPFYECYRLRLYLCLTVMNVQLYESKSFYLFGFFQ